MGKPTLKLIVFDLDCTMWPFHVDMYTYSPPFKRKNGKVVDSHGQEMKPYPGSLEVLEYWSTKCEIGVASRTTYPPGAESLLDMFGFNKYIKYKEIYPGCKLAHFKRLQKQSGYEMNEMLFFDDEPRNIRDVKSLGVECILVDDEVGVTKKQIEDIVKDRFSGVSKE